MSILVPLGVGLAIAFAATKLDLKDYLRREQRITPRELAFGSVVVVLLALVVTQFVGPHLSREHAINGYHEFLNGSIVAAQPSINNCSKTEEHGSDDCASTYRCDSYSHKVVDRAAYTDSDNHYHSEQYHYETWWHRCPYVTQEVDYNLYDNFGRTITIGNNYFTADPVVWRPRAHKGIPSDVPRQPPERWLRAQRDLQLGFTEPVTVPNDYPNYILASDSALFKRYSGDVDQLKKAGLLPKHTANLGSDMWYDYDMRADKLQAVGGLTVNDLPRWEDRLMRFDAALGNAPNPVTKKGFQGDMHVVLLPANKVSNPDDYINTLKVYWTSLGKWSISKNGIILAIGASPDGRTVAWSRAVTGMPFGNGSMIEALSHRLRDLPLDPDVLFGNVAATVQPAGNSYKDYTVNYNLNASGVIGTYVFKKHPFIRGCMVCKSKGDHGSGYVNLRNEVPITTGAKITMFVIVFFISLGVWFALLATDPLGYLLSPSTTKRTRRPYEYN